VEGAIPHLIIELLGGPAAGTSDPHAGDHPMDLGGVVLKGLRTGANIRPTECVEGHCETQRVGKIHL